MHDGAVHYEWFYSADMSSLDNYQVQVVILKIRQYTAVLLLLATAIKA